MSLMEMLIALALTSLILVSLTYFFHETNSLNTSLDQEKKRAFQKTYLQNRLANVLPKTLSPNDKDFLFFTSVDANSLFKENSQSLLFSFNNGINLNNPFANHVIGRLFVDRNNQFCLAIMPSKTYWGKNPQPGNIPIKKEILASKVEKVSFFYFLPPEKNREKFLTKPFTIEAGNEGKWVPQWKKEYKQLPPLIKILLKMEGVQEELVFILPLPNSELVIVYDK